MHSSDSPAVVLSHHWPGIAASKAKTAPSELDEPLRNAIDHNQLSDDLTSSGDNLVYYSPGPSSLVESTEDPAASHGDPALLDTHERYVEEPCDVQTCCTDDGSDLL